MIMKKEKGVIISIILVFIIIVSVISVSAGFLDFIFGEKTSGETGELGESHPSTANVEITGVATPPRIVYVSAPNATDLNEYGSTQKIFQFSFVVCSDGGPSVLYPNVGAVPAKIDGSFNNSANNPSVVQPISACVVSGNVGTSIFGGAITCPADMMNYTCFIQMQYYYEPGDWTINATVTDTNDNRDTNNTRSFALDSLLAWKRNYDHVNWSGLAAGATDLPADNTITINLTGNIDIDGSNPLTINATNLTHETDPLMRISAYDFAAHSNYLAPCTVAGQSDLEENKFITVTGFDIDHTASNPAVPASDQVGFCLETTAGLAQGKYQSPNDWVLKAFG